MRALITGATGQDGRYLCDLLLSKGYEVHALRRPSTTERHLKEGVRWHEADMADSASLERVVQKVAPDEFYNLAAQSHVGASFEAPEWTFRVNALGVITLLKAARESKARFYQASTSELFGSSPAPQNEQTPFCPRSPYAVAKLAAYWAVLNYRGAYGLHASNGILFNHESPLRGLEFVTHKITRAVAEFARGRNEPLRLGNLDAKRDWGFAGDYVEAMWRILQQPEPGDYVIATGVAHSVREFCDAAFGCIGTNIQWHGSGVDEVGRDRKTGRTLIVVDPALYRPAEVNHLCGDYSKARAILGWQPTLSLDELVSRMVAADAAALERQGANSMPAH